MRASASGGGWGRRLDLWCLILALCLSEVLYLLLWKLSFISHNNKDVLAVRFLACVCVLFLLCAGSYLLLQRREGNTSQQLLVIAIGAVLFRATLLGVGMEQVSSAKGAIHSAKIDIRGEEVTYGRFLLFDDDVWRYLWDGHVLAYGINPYQYAPCSPELDYLAESEGPLWREIRANVNHQDLPTVYPPLAQQVFRLAHWIRPGSILAWKGVVIVIDLIAALFIALTLHTLNRPVTAVILYAWNPLVITMSAGSAHIDSLAAATVAATAYFVARRTTWQAALSFALAIASKLAPLLLLPFIARRLSRKGMMLAAVLLVVVYWPFLDGAIFRNLKIFVYHWRFNSAWFVTLEWCLRPLTSDANYWARMLSGIILLAVVIRLFRHDQRDVQAFLNAGATSLGLLLLLSPTVMPWYVVWLLPMAVAAQKHIWIYFSGCVCLSVLMMNDWQPQAWVLAMEYGSFVVVVGWVLICNLVSDRKFGSQDLPARLLSRSTDEMLRVRQEITP